ncbi:MAG TPA: protein-L-isoaspartate(D-aspartate) O-methyltransferase [Thermoanaerobaculia bacterium]|nr:protein-L-isoaspartate(D-aspartate) O-methyltransferase [Thermoanaerobaculia bacterium]
MKPADRDVERAARAGARRALVERLKSAGLCRDPRVAEAIGSIPRHLFVPVALQGEAYGDHALPIGYGQTITQAANVARAAELAALTLASRVLEIGTGSGYQAAVLARLARWVFSLERVAALGKGAVHLLRTLGVANVSIKIFDGSYGWSEHAPYDAILVSAAAPEVPEPLLAQLAAGGRLVIPVGPAARQKLLVVRKLPNGRTRAEDAGEVAYVPLVGRFGFAPAETQRTSR